MNFSLQKAVRSKMSVTGSSIYTGYRTLTHYKASIIYRLGAVKSWTKTERAPKYFQVHGV